jgi:hypothetical protein
MDAVEGQVEGQKIIDAIGLLVTSRDPLMGSFGQYLRASAGLEAWLAAGAPIDTESVKPILGDLKTALSSLTTLGTAALGVAGVSGRAVGLEPDTEATN